MVREKWLDCVRGVAMIGVVLQHIHNVTLHPYELQVLFMFCTPVLIMLMGLTMMWGIDRRVKNGAFRNQSVYYYIIIRLKPTVIAYVVATLFNTSYEYSWPGLGFSDYVTHLLNFDANGPFYFIFYFISLSLLAPVIHFMISMIDSVRMWTIRYGLYVVSLLGTLVLGYICLKKAPYMGGSFLTLYTFGMMLGRVSIPKYSREIGLIGLPIAIIAGYYVLPYGLTFLREGYFKQYWIDQWTPELHLIPSSVSVMIYSIGVLLVLIAVFNISEHHLKKNNPLILLFSCLGRYSIDIFLWHMLILHIAVNNLGFLFANPISSVISCYICVLVVPVLGRIVYNKAKRRYCYILQGEKE